MKILVIEAKEGRYRISVYPSSLGCFLEYRNKQKRKIDRNFIVARFSANEGNNEILLDDEFKERKHPGILKGYYIHIYWRENEESMWFTEDIVDHGIKNAYWDQVTERELRLIMKARLLK